MFTIFQFVANHELTLQGDTKVEGEGGTDVYMQANAFLLPVLFPKFVEISVQGMFLACS